MKLFLAAIVAFSFFLVEVPVGANGSSFGPAELQILD